MIDIKKNNNIHIMTSTYNMRYDRQVQIFGKDAQSIIENCLIVVDSLTIATTEVMKNAVMSGFQVDLRFIRNSKCFISFSHYISHFPQKSQIPRVNIK